MFYASFFCPTIVWVYFFQNPNLLKVDEKIQWDKIAKHKISLEHLWGYTPKTSVFKHPNVLNRGAGLKYTSILHGYQRRDHLEGEPEGKSLGGFFQSFFLSG